MQIVAKRIILKGMMPRNLLANTDKNILLKLLIDRYVVVGIY